MPSGIPPASAFTSAVQVELGRQDLGPVWPPSHDDSVDAIPGVQPPPDFWYVGFQSVLAQSAEHLGLPLIPFKLYAWFRSMMGFPQPLLKMAPSLWWLLLTPRYHGGWISRRLCQFQLPFPTGLHSCYSSSTGTSFTSSCV